MKSLVSLAPSWDPMLEVELVAKQLGSMSPAEQLCERLVLNEIIATGASGTVYRGRWRNIDVAVKVKIDWSGEKCGTAEGTQEWVQSCDGMIAGHNIHTCMLRNDFLPPGWLLGMVI